MDEKEQLNNLIDNPKYPSVGDWVYEVESFLKCIGETSRESTTLIWRIKLQGDSFSCVENLVALLRQIYKRKYDGITLPQLKKRNQVFVAMMFSEDMDLVYRNAIKPVIESLSYIARRIDEKQFNGSIIGEITKEIADSIVLIADLTGNRGGVYYEAGVARGLQLCNHPVELVFICRRDFFDNEGVHFDVQGDNIILYTEEAELKEKLMARLQAILLEEASK